MSSADVGWGQLFGSVVYGGGSDDGMLALGT